MTELTPSQTRKVAQDAGDVFGDVVIAVQAMFVRVSIEQHKYIKANNLEVPVFGGIPVYYVITEDGE